MRDNLARQCRRNEAARSRDAQQRQERCAYLDLAEHFGGVEPALFTRADIQPYTIAGIVAVVGEE